MTLRTVCQLDTAPNLLSYLLEDLAELDLLLGGKSPSPTRSLRLEFLGGLELAVAKNGVGC